MPITAILVGVLLGQQSSTQPLRWLETGKGKLKWEAKATLARFSGRTAVQRLAGKVLYDDSRKIFIDFIRNARNSQNDGYAATSAGWELELVSKVETVSGDLVSFTINGYDYSGGAHPNHFTNCYTFGLKNSVAARLKLDDIVDANSVISKFVLPRVNNQKKEREAELLSKIEAPNYDSFVITKKGLQWLFSAYTLGSYAEGDYDATVTFKEIAPYVKKGGALAKLMARTTRID